ncbi:P-loop containing nucleoside triphosphate hydrolase protein [Corynascus novoguineensis]|uniref:P-loop containing nucleoside triphosphate hydrolase protein n=1 Tax=Corynascus novoguineensis TaxID=1126955 RepID=A0AAN7CUF6_9PEZI|nr:P-loop containing nucleoside triphosphate hydrolase protein [Corynascus novoguineensis]
MAPEDLLHWLSIVNASAFLILTLNRRKLRGFRVKIATGASGQTKQGPLLSHDIPKLDRDLNPKHSRESMVKAWNGRAKPETAATLPLALLSSVRRHFSALVIPRLLLVLFRYCQPILTRLSIQFVATSGTGNSSPVAQTDIPYQHRLDKLKIVTRSALVGIIHDKSMSLASEAHDSSEAVTLMSFDAEGLDDVPEMIHELWAHILEVVIGIVMLSREVGWIWPLPLLLIFFCSRMSRYVAKHLQPGQKAWNAATQRRVAATSYLLSSMKLIKMLGLQQAVASRIQPLRKEELSTAARVRWTRVYYNASANALGIFSPAITLLLFALVAAHRGHALKAETAFTTMAVLSMVTHPANMVMTILPRGVAAFAGFQRIQAYLLKPPLFDARVTLPEKGNQSHRSPTLAVRLRDVAFGDRHAGLILRNVSMEVSHGSLVIVSGSVGSGKSMLLRALLGEIQLAQGSIQLASTRVAYCAQKPWLPNGSIKQAICGMDDNQGNSRWYQQVIDACCLRHDFKLLPEGDRTRIGSRGLNLSGGQRQRIALARALFARCDIVLLDDVFSALDQDTERTVFQKLFGPTGLCRRLHATVILVTNSPQFLPIADQILILDDGGVKAKGNWEAIRHKTSSSISKFRFQQQSHSGPNPPKTTSSTKLSDQLQAMREAEADLARRTGDLGLYCYYFRFIGVANLALLAGCAASYSLFITIPQHWLMLWTKANGQNQLFYVCGFMLLSLISWASTSALMWSSQVRIAPYSGLALHEHLLAIVTDAPLSFFSSTGIGSILNRFTEDVQMVDKQLPSALQNLAVQTFKLLVQGILLCMAEKWLVLLFPACASMVCIIAKIYFVNSRQLQFLELESRAAVMSNFLESASGQAEGLETIRAFGWHRAAEDQNVKRLETSQRTRYLLICLQRWLNLVLDIIAAAVAIGVIGSAVALRGRIGGGQVGVALNLMLVANTTLLRLVDSWTNLEVSMGAIARLKALEETTPSESNQKAIHKPIQGWPRRGQIEFEGVTAVYHTGAIAVRKFTLTISPGQRVTICGRTGSGKSSLLLTLLRMLDLHSGTIKLDGVDITQIPHDHLRQRCFVTVSQDGLLLPNETVRFNLDPECLLEDHVIIDALKKTNLWARFLCKGREEEEEEEEEEENERKRERSDDSSSHNQLGRNRLRTKNYTAILGKKLSDFPSFSAGETQMFNLSRGVLKAWVLRASGGRPVVLLDEVTSTLDAATEAAAHQILESEFTAWGHTVIVVSHRLGRLAELARPGRDVVARLRDGRLEGVWSDVRDLVVDGEGGLEGM